MNKKICLLMLLSLFLIIPRAYADPIKDIEVSGLPEEIVAGNSYDITVTFETTKTMDVTLNLQAICEEAPLNKGEIMVNSLKLNGAPITINEESPGVFISEKDKVTAGLHKYTLTVSSLVNLMPGTYTFQFTVLGEVAKPPSPPSGPPHPPPEEPEQPPEEPPPPEEPEPPEEPPEEPELPEPPSEEPGEPEEPEAPPEEPEHPPEEPEIPETPETPEEPEPPKPPVTHITWVIALEILLALIVICVWLKTR